MDSAASDPDNAIDSPLHSGYKAAQGEALSKEERLHFQSLLLNAVGQALIATDLQGNVIYWNRGAENLYGWSAKEVMGRSIMEVTPSEELIERAEDIMAELLAGRSWSGEFMVRRKDGTTFPAMVTDTPVHDEHGNLIAIIGVSMEITEIKQTEELRRSEERFRLLAENAQDIIYRYRYKPTPGFEYVSPSAASIVGYTPEEYYADPELGFKIAHPDDRYLLDEVLRYPESPITIRSLRKDGTIIWTEQRNKPIYDEAGELVAIEGIARDVTETKKAEEALKESEVRFRLLVKGVKDYAIFMLDAQGHITTWNEGARRIKGYEAEEIIGKHFSTFYPEEDVRRGHPEEELRVAAQEGVYEEEGLRIRKDSSGFWASVLITALRDEEGNLRGFSKVVRDITERKQAEEEKARRASHQALRADVSASLAEGGTLQSILQRCMEIMARHLEAAFARIWTLNEEENVLELRASARMYTHLEGTHSRVPVGRGKIGLIAQERLPHLTNDVLNDPRIGNKEWAKREGMVAFAGYPLIVEDRLVGVMAMFARKALEEDTIEALASVADAIAQGIQRKWAEAALRSSEEFFRALYENAQHPIFLLDEDLNFIDVNPYACEFYGYSREEFRRMKVPDITPPEEQDDQLRNVERILKQGRVFVRERRHRRKNGELVTITADAARITRSGQELYVSKITDITERKRAEEQLHHQAFHDLLTNLPNRYLLADRLKQALRHTSRQSGRRVAVLFVDLDNFKAVNDSLGHEVGDKLLVRASERLRGCIRPEDTLARFGGDEFIVILEEIEGPDDALRVAERISEEFRIPIVLEGRELFVRVSIGVALGTSRTKSAEDLLKDADTAMFRAKAEGMDYLVFDPQMYLQAVNRLELENDLRRAIDAEEFVLHYQPIVNLESGEVRAVEALVRWNHPERGFLDPEEFVQVAEESGLIIPLGERVLEEACRQAKEWQDEHPHIPPLLISVNLSARQLRRPDLATTVEEILQRTGFEAACMNLDITETVYIKVLEGNTQALDELKRLGVKISVDDFGVGYSSLSYLKRLPADTLKIDKSFAKGVGEDVEDTAIVRMVIELAHTLGLEVIAEGVEGWTQAALLREMGCDMAQGYYFSKPLPSEEAAEFLAEELTQ